MEKKTLAFLSSLNLLASKTYFVLFKYEKNIALDGEDFRTLKEFANKLEQINKVITNPFDYAEQEEDLIQLVEIIEFSQSNKKKLEDNLKQLNDLINNITKKPNGLLNFVKNINIGIDQIISDDNDDLTKIREISFVQG